MDLSKQELLAKRVDLALGNHLNC